MLVHLLWREKTGVPGEKPSEQEREPETTATKTINQSILNLSVVSQSINQLSSQSIN